MPQQIRQLAAIMFTDIVGYTRLMGEDEQKAMQVLRKNRKIHQTNIKKYHGKWLKEMGDGTLASFKTVSDAIYCAGELIKGCNADDIQLRIGIHQGEVIEEDGDIFGDGVNIASRLEPLAPIGGILVSESVNRNLENKKGIETKFLREEKLKNVKAPVRIYEVTVEGIDSPEQLSSDQTDGSETPRGQIKPSSQRKLVFASLGIILILLLAYFTYDFLNKKESLIQSAKSDIIDKSIAVLPFRNDSPDQENEYFCNGMMETIRNHLGKIQDLKVKSSFDVERYRNHSKSIQVISSELGVANILTGSVYKQGNSLRIMVQLINAESGFDLWSDSYENDFTDEIFKIQSDIAQQVASALNSIITPVEEQRIDHRPTTDASAYDYWLKGLEIQKNYSNTKDKKDLINANNLFDKALTIDPEYAAAFVGKGRLFYIEKNYDSALIYADRAIKRDKEYEGGYILKGICLNEMGEYDLAIEYLLTAVEISPNNSTVNLRLGYAYIRAKDDPIKGLPYLQKALELSDEDRAGIYHSIGKSYFHLSDYEKAEKYYLKAHELQIGCEGITSYTYLLHNQGRFEEALQFEDSICKITDCQRNCNYQMVVTYVYMKKFKLAEKHLQRRIEVGTLSDWGTIMQTYLYKELGRNEEAMRILNDTQIKLENQLTKYKTRGTYFLLSQIHAIQNEKNKAIMYLIEYEKMGFSSNWHDEIQIYPPFTNLWDDPEFKAIVKRAQEKKEAIRAQLREMEERGEIYL